MQFPVSEKELTRDYKAVTNEVDKLSRERYTKIWLAWPEFVNRAGTWECLRDLHIALFGGLFSFAGEIRKVNISKGGFRFANYIFLQNNIPIVTAMSQKDFDSILAKYIEMNILHPFREGNGRAARLWLDSMLERELNTRVNWQKISRDDYFQAIERSPVNELELTKLLKDSLLSPDLLKNEKIFAEDLSASYDYEM